MTCGDRFNKNCPTGGTRVDPTEVDGRPLCDHEGCGKPLLGNGECVDGHVQGALDNYIASKSGKPYKPLAPMVERWQGRIVPNGWQRWGETGAEAYLRAYGKGIGSDKCIALARHAESMGFPALARGFWRKAYEIELGQPAPADEVGQEETTAPTHAAPPADSRAASPRRTAPAASPPAASRAAFSVLDEYSAGKRGSSFPFGEIQKRWQTRMIPKGWDQQGEAGAQAYLEAYGRNIGSDKCVHLALYAESAGCPDVARGFWRKAYELEHGAPPPADDKAVRRSTAEAAVPGATPRTTPTVAGLPDHLQPGMLVTMQPVDTAQPREFYINDPAWWGQPKRDGERRPVMAGDVVCYQSRSRVREMPSAAIDRALAQAAQEHGPFVLDGEVFYLDAEGHEHRTAAQAVTANLTSGHAGEFPRVRYAIFKALYAEGRDLTGQPESERIAAGEKIGRTLTALTEEIEVLPTARTSEEKAALVARQVAEGREGEVWVRADCTYVGGKNTTKDAPIVRTKYITEEVDVVVLGLTPSKAADRPFGAIRVGMYVQGELVPMGSIGTGYTRAEMEEIAQAHAATPGQVVITVGSQGTTEKGKLWQGRYRGLHLDKPPEECVSDL